MTDPVRPVASYPGLFGQRVLVIGTGDGIGQAVVRSLAQNGSAVACADLDFSKATEASKLVARGFAISVDVMNASSLSEALDEAVVRLGSIDHIVDVVGMLRPSLIAEADDDLWDWHFGVVFTHARRLLKLASTKMSAGGTLTFVGSTAGMFAMPNNGPYGAAKAALISLVKTAAIELAPQRIRVNAVAPGVVSTPRMLSLLAERNLLSATEAVIPLGRLASPVDVANAILFLSSESASFITGQTLVVDGGVQYASLYPAL